MSIDAERLAKAKEWARHMASCNFDTVNLTALADAAEQVLAALPRYKEVEVVQWAVISRGGVVLTLARSEEALNAHISCGDGRSIVRLTGIAKVRA